MGYNERHATLIKKAEELSILCGAEIAVFTLTADGRHDQYSTTTVEHTLARYNKYKNKNMVRGCRPRASMAAEERNSRGESSRRGALMGQEAALRLEINRRNGMELGGLSKEELCILEEQQIQAVLSVKNKKEELLRRMLPQRWTYTVPQTQNLLLGFETRSSSGTSSDCSSENSDTSAFTSLRLEL